jgi:hypothetical protein
MVERDAAAGVADRYHCTLLVRFCGDRDRAGLLLQSLGRIEQQLNEDLGQLGCVPQDMGYAGWR